MKVNDLFIHPVLEIYNTTPMAGDISGLIANMGQKIKFAQADNTVEAKNRIKDDFNELLKRLTPQDNQKYNRQLVDYKNKIIELIKTKSDEEEDSRIDKETIQNMEFIQKQWAGGFKNQNQNQKQGFGGFKDWFASLVAK